MQGYEAGWQAISEYTGAPIAEVKEAAALGELLVEQRGEWGHLDAWVRLRALRRELADEVVDLVPDAGQPLG